MQTLSFLCVWTFYHPVTGFIGFIALACAVYYAIDKMEALV